MTSPVSTLFGPHSTKPQAPKLDFYSNLTGEKLTDFSDMPGYLADHLVSPVQFVRELQAIHSAGADGAPDSPAMTVCTGELKLTGRTNPSVSSQTWAISSGGRLAKTETAQPAILAASLIAFGAVQKLGISPAMVAGHSLGEYAAMAASGMLSLEDAFQKRKQMLFIKKSCLSEMGWKAREKVSRLFEF